MLALYHAGLPHKRNGAATQDGDAMTYQRGVDRITAQLNHAGGDSRQSVRLAHLYLARASLMAITAYERQHHSDPDGQTQPDEEAALREYALWCHRYLAINPGHAVSDTVRVTRTALRQEPPPQKRRRLLIILATALSYLGRHDEEMAALRQAASFVVGERHSSGIRPPHGYLRLGHSPAAVSTPDLTDRPCAECFAEY